MLYFVPPRQVIAHYVDFRFGIGDREGPGSLPIAPDRSGWLVSHCPENAWRSQVGLQRQCHDAELGAQLKAS